VGSAVARGWLLLGIVLVLRLKLLGVGLMPGPDSY
jgi:hypothetical protein